jgi:uncharacterized membrane protein YdbT with pleckstrin-like domain
MSLLSAYTPYARSILTTDESILYVARLHPFHHPKVLSGAVASALLTYYISTWLIFIPLGFMLWHQTYSYLFECVVTDKRLIVRQGVISIDVDEINPEIILSWHIDQSILGKILSLGHVNVMLFHCPPLKLRFLLNPVGFVKKLQILEPVSKKGLHHPKK